MRIDIAGIIYFMCKVLQRYIIFVLPLVILAPGVSNFLFPGSGSPYTDILISHYPNARYLIDSIKRWQSVPLWSDSILGGYPFIANPLSGLWYPFGYLAYLFPLPFGFNLAMGIHMIWGGFGMYQLLRGEGASQQAARFGGLIFSILPKFYAHISAGHLSLIYAIPWTPWLLAIERGGLHTGALMTRKYLPGILIGLIFLADPRWAPYAGILWLVYKIAHRYDQEIRTHLRVLLTNGISSLIVTGPVLVPFIEFIRFSTRATLSNEENLVHSLTPAGLLGILLPDPQGYHEWCTYLGGAVFILSASTAISCLHDRRRSFWSMVLVSSLLLALGEYFPLNKFIVELPVFNLLRVPARALFITGMSSSALAAYGFDTLLYAGHFRSYHPLRTFVFGVSVFSLLLMIGILFSSGSLGWKTTWGLASVIAGGLWVNFRLYSRFNERVWVIGMLLFVILDLGIFSRMSYIPHAPEDVFRKTEELGKYLANKTSLFRTYSPSYSLPQQTAARFSLQMSDGIDPMQLSAYVDYMATASGVPRSVYGVTVPEFAGGEPTSDNRKYKPDAELLGRLNVAYIISEFDIESRDLLLEQCFGDTRIYKNLKSRPRAWIQPNLEDSSLEWREVESVDWRPNQIEIFAKGPGFLILSEITYPGWIVSVDGKRQPILSPDGILRGVYLDPGEHRVRFAYLPISLYSGISLSMIGILGLMGIRRLTVRNI